ncbi:MAG: hypothetical protein QNJ34_18835 [Xenococcaceae cyanobacterium MO_188.B29]|nr:hypothetical protein [Xenococcaceae cyanobacterium MO_188.B29]
MFNLDFGQYKERKWRTNMTIFFHKPLFIFVLVSTAVSISYSYSIAMMLLTTFILAYLTKGSRRKQNRT